LNIIGNEPKIHPIYQKTVENGRESGGQKGRALGDNVACRDDNKNVKEVKRSLDATRDVDKSCNQKKVKEYLKRYLKGQVFSPDVQNKIDKRKKINGDNHIIKRVEWEENRSAVLNDNRGYN